MHMNVTALDRASLGRALTRLANAGVSDAALRPLPVRPATLAHRIGVTGAPGAGKSTLVGHLAMQRLQTRARLGVLAVDPSSPHSGGAILGDRIRMDDLAGSHELYIRSLGSRKTTDGLADNLPEMLDLMDAYGFGEVLLETVGVGQAEYAVRAQVDTLVLVLLPDSGDVVQAMKAGIMEMADIFVVNKADLPGAQRMVADIRRIAAVSRHTPDAWIAPILLTASSQPESITALSQAIDQHQAWLARNGGQQQSLHTLRARYRLKRTLELRLGDAIAREDTEFFSKPVAEQLAHILEIARAQLAEDLKKGSTC
ncbi:MAG: GTP-binding protein [Comamonas sp.]|uniref:ArgK/MeaB family GTPase n=1 Tax=Comamonas sp. TaxID=34028 RepID=UPI002FC964A5